LVGNRSLPPNRFQKQCDGDVHARYQLLGDGKVGVRNECRKANGKHDISNGTAKVADPKSNAKLRVTFFWPFAGDDWIIYLDKDYRYAVVGEPDRKDLWILGRKDMDNATYQKILQHVAESGYDTSKLVRTKQSRETVSNFQHDGIFLSGQIRNLPIAYLVAIPNSRGAYDIATEN
jgi:apolipoprotein D and lipocalin family protein